MYRFSPSLTDLVSTQHKMNNGKYFDIYTSFFNYCFSLQYLVGEHVDLRSLEPNMLTGLVKCFFRELEPEPIIPFDSYESLIAGM